MSKERHEKYGEIREVFLSTDNQNFSHSEIFDSMIIDCAINMNPIQVDDKDGIVTQIEETAPSAVQFIKLSNWIRKFFAIVGMSVPVQEIQGRVSSEIARRLIIEFTKKVRIPVSYQIPSDKNAMTDRLFELAYKNSYVYDNYNADNNSDRR